MTAINLLPTEISPKGPVAKISNLIKNLAVISFVLFLLTALGMLAMFILNSVQIRSLNESSEELKTSIKSLEATEQGLILVKDRLSKAKLVLADESGTEEAEGLGSLTVALPGSVALTEAVIAKNGLETTFIATDSQGLTVLMARIISQEAFSKVDLVSFSFNPNTGYIPSFAVKMK
ncbi:MAG: hypothetical protein UX88_C0001G0042 [Candidatus Woesebacteria bacterium GW2011_GWC2_47_16]|uniref:Fimbrial assembly family protein n=8 Tax=Candidatus Woeseibacteriota TaxID=1752722 RepID=A0A0G1QWT2_9BACT|nr:MAG: hypothetical protein UX03_C0003G0009 [Candidatus Woesebacteria bacterium GW2011_GWE1_45_18]KKU25145.1 MAG: hypothetical protein UX34_C0002G0008 [Candidatus Woesebacteria bacterium GW2011_GWF1_46_13]KKU49334.1 MAG: hypothetical protein UX67_C0002G0019 [Candidatus Woesebacteria bacterium GW2011_GWF2_46_8]KKU65382.1 MAG: hypothetical protein UX88_C0001G0042 [Candidatus Woesebacteria bacterium GW2011_GWC2_47_16]KKU71191.1 MAG: hypothetical protein UX95_C0002G0012 [Candidatus Woesebacteria b